MKYLSIRNLLLAAGLGALAACGGGSGSGSSGVQSLGTSTGAAMVTLTDAPGDFLMYKVVVSSITLTRDDGTVVETVPTPTPVDFSQLVNLSEVISAAQVPQGRYVSAQLTLDYLNATNPAVITVDNGASGVTVPTSNIQDSTGAALTAPLTISLTLPAGTPLVVT